MLDWRLAFCMLPTDEILKRRHLDVDYRCIFCKDEMETYLHVFLVCPATIPL